MAAIVSFNQAMEVRSKADPKNIMSPLSFAKRLVLIACVGKHMDPHRAVKEDTY